MAPGRLTHKKNPQTKAKPKYPSILYVFWLRQSKKAKKPKYFPCYLFHSRETHTKYLGFLALLGCLNEKT